MSGFNADGISANASPGLVKSTGWSYGTISNVTGSTQNYHINMSLPGNITLNATLNWFVHRQLHTLTYDPAGVTTEGRFMDLDLLIYRSETPGGPPVKWVAASNSNNNNTEHLSFLIPEAGYYTIHVQTAGTRWAFDSYILTRYGLAWAVRPNLMAQSHGPVIVSAAVDYPGNILIANIADASLTLRNGAYIESANNLYMGTEDRHGVGGKGTLTIDDSTLNVSNTAILKNQQTVNLNNAWFRGGWMRLGANNTIKNLGGDSIMGFTRYLLEGDGNQILSSAGTLTLPPFYNTDNRQIAEIALEGHALKLGGDGTLAIASNIHGFGVNSLRKIGTGMTILSGDNSFAGNVHIEAGTLRLANAQAHTVIPVDVLANNAIFDVVGNYFVDTDRKTNLIQLTRSTLRADSGVNGGLTLHQLTMLGGTIDLTGTQFYRLVFDGATAQWSVNAEAGLPSLGKAGFNSAIINNTPTALKVIVGNNPTTTVIQFDTSIPFSDLGSNKWFEFTGPGTIRTTTSHNTANFLLSDGVTFRVDAPTHLGSGDIVLNAGHLAYGGASDATIAKPLETIADGSGIRVLHSVKLTQSGLISGIGGLVKSGPGTLILSAANTYEGPTKVTQGTLKVMGDMSAATGHVTVETSGVLPEKATLSGTGIVGGHTTIKGGLTGYGQLEPGNPFGRLSFQNGLTMNKGSVLELNITDGPSSTVNGGSTILDGGIPTNNNFIRILGGTADLHLEITVFGYVNGTGFEAHKPYSYHVGSGMGDKSAFEINLPN